MMSSICLAKTAVSFGAAASATRTQPANGAAAAPASSRRLEISVMVSSHVLFTLAILHPDKATVHYPGSHTRPAIASGLQQQLAGDVAPLETAMHFRRFCQWKDAFDRYLQPAGGD